MDLRLLADDDLPVQVDRYRLLGLLGQGGMARVFRAELGGERGFRKPVALKVLVPTSAEQTASLASHLAQEARLGALLNHPNIAQVHDYGTLQGHPFVAFELVEGASLDRLLQAGPLPPEAVVDLGLQAAAGLHAAHTAVDGEARLHVVHRDIKPSNLMVRPDGLVKIVDFGIAKAAAADAPTTEHGVVKGTAAYLAPEQLAGEAVDGRTDLFALGSVLGGALLGRPAFSGASVTAIMFQVAQGARGLREQGFFDDVEAVSAPLRPVLERLLSTDPDERYPDAAALVEALRPLASEGRRSLAARAAAAIGQPAAAVATHAVADTVTLAASAPPQTGASAPGGRSWPLLGGLALLGLVGVVGVASRGDAPPSASSPDAVADAPREAVADAPREAIAAPQVSAGGPREAVAAPEEVAPTPGSEASSASAVAAATPESPGATARPEATTAAPAVEAAAGGGLPLAIPPADPVEEVAPVPSVVRGSGLVVTHTPLGRAAGRSVFLKASVEGPSSVRGTLHAEGASGGGRVAKPLIPIEGTWGASVTLDGPFAEGVRYWFEVDPGDGQPAVQHGSEGAPHRLVRGE
jgi:hypothetical protein